MQKFKEGDICPKSATYEQFRDEDDEYAGATYRCYIRKKYPFPAGEPNHYFMEVGDSDIYLSCTK